MRVLRQKHLSGDGEAATGVTDKSCDFSVMCLIFVFPISFALRGVCADPPAALCNLAKCWTGPVVC